jgi:hypothetical protein
MGRWVSRDPIGYGGGSKSLHEYNLGNPTNLVDPSGKDICLNCKCLRRARSTRFGFDLPIETLLDYSVKITCREGMSAKYCCDWACLNLAPAPGDNRRWVGRPQVTGFDKCGARPTPEFDCDIASCAAEYAEYSAFLIPCLASAPACAAVCVGTGGTACLACLIALPASEYAGCREAVSAYEKYIACINRNMRPR